MSSFNEEEYANQPADREAENEAMGGNEAANEPDAKVETSGVGTGKDIPQSVKCFTALRGIVF